MSLVTESTDHWLVDEEVGEDGAVHVWPEYDRIEHKLSGYDCECGPTVELYEHGNLVIHNKAN